MIFNPILVPHKGTDYKTHSDAHNAWKSGAPFFWVARSLIVTINTLPLHSDAPSVDIRFYNRKHLVTITHRTYGVAC